MSCPGTETLDPRVRRTRQLLHDAFHSLLKEKEYPAISVQDIAERATVNRATFYAHYPDKQALVEQVLKTDFHHFLKDRVVSLDTMTPEGLETITVAIIEFMANIAGGCAASAKGMCDDIQGSLQEEIYDLFRHWLTKDTPEVLKPHHPDTIATTFAWTIYGAAHRWTHGSRKRKPEAVAKAIVAMLLPKEVAWAARP